MKDTCVPYFILFHPTFTQNSNVPKTVLQLITVTLLGGHGSAGEAEAGVRGSETSQVHLEVAPDGLQPGEPAVIRPYEAEVGGAVLRGLELVSPQEPPAQALQGGEDGPGPHLRGQLQVEAVAGGGGLEAAAGGLQVGQPRQGEVRGQRGQHQPVKLRSPPEDATVHQRGLDVDCGGGGGGSPRDVVGEDHDALLRQVDVLDCPVLQRGVGQQVPALGDHHLPPHSGGEAPCHHHHLQALDTQHSPTQTLYLHYLQATSNHKACPSAGAAAAPRKMR